jgi:hypothetical protein
MVRPGTFFSRLAVSLVAGARDCRVSVATAEELSGALCVGAVTEIVGSCASSATAVPWTVAAISVARRARRWGNGGCIMLVPLLLIVETVAFARPAQLGVSINL